MKTKARTNEKIVKDIMTRSKYGALAQMFVMDAINKLANTVAESKPSEYPKNGFISPEAWIGVAKEIQKELKEHLK